MNQFIDMEVSSQAGVPLYDGTSSLEERVPLQTESALEPGTQVWICTCIGYQHREADADGAFWDGGRRAMLQRQEDGWRLMGWANPEVLSAFNLAK